MEIGQREPPIEALRSISAKMSRLEPRLESGDSELAFAVFGVGNIHGFGLAMTEYCMERGEPCRGKGEA